MGYAPMTPGRLGDGFDLVADGTPDSRAKSADPELDCVINFFGQVIWAAIEAGSPWDLRVCTAKSEAERLLVQGWWFAAALPEGRVLLRKHREPDYDARAVVLSGIRQDARSMVAIKEWWASPRTERPALYLNGGKAGGGGDD